jgi:hypothetical protein
MLSLAFALITLSGSPAAFSIPQQLVAPQKLVALLPQVPDWTKGEPDTDTIAVGMPMCLARVSYEKGGTTINLEIIDTAKNQMTLTGLTMVMKEGGIVETSGKGYRKSITIAGHPGVESWDPEGSTADVLVIVAARFLVKATASDVKDTTAARRLVEAVDYRALAALQ